jgi:hypothetical protein
MHARRDRGGGAPAGKRVLVGQVGGAGIRLNGKKREEIIRLIKTIRLNSTLLERYIFHGEMELC